MSNRKHIINKVIIILLVIWLLFSLFTFIYFSKICKVVKENPLKYAAKEYNIDSCTCFTTTGENIFFDQEKVWKTKSTIIFKEKEET